MDDKWKIWDDLPEYGENFYQRSIEAKGEMESSKSAAKIVSTIIKDKDKILDVGCGAGHYLASLDKIINNNFSYQGVDATKNYIQLAKKAYNGKSTEYRDIPSFEQGDIFNLLQDNNYADIVMCNNVLLHLPEIKKPISELWRVSKKYLLIRTLVGETSLRIKFIKDPEEFDEFGEPSHYNYHNIYSKSYIEKIIDSLEDVKSYKIFQDTDFSQENIGKHNFEEDYKEDEKKFVTTILDGMQTTSYVLQPWCYILIEK